MTRPRLIHRNASYRLSSRCVFRQSLLKPGRELNNAVGYWLGVTSQRYGILVHSFCVMSNHIHLNVAHNDLRSGCFVSQQPDAESGAGSVLGGAPVRVPGRGPPQQPKVLHDLPRRRE